MKNYRIIITICIAFILISIGSCIYRFQKDRKHEGSERFLHVKVGYPSDTNNLKNHTDTIVISSNFKDELSKALHLVGTTYVSMNMTKKNIFFTHPITNEIERVNFGINGGCQFAAYIHKKFGLLFLTRTDWRKDEYIPIIPSKQDAQKIKSAISYCMSYAKDSVIPSPKESAR
jgi:hypothetical protein